MSKNIYIEEYSGQYDTFDYFISADVENSGIITVTAFLNHDRIATFHQLLVDFNSMLCFLKERFRHEQGLNKVVPENKEYEVKLEPNEHEVVVTLYHADYDTESLSASFAYAVGYVQSYMIHGFSESVLE